MPLPFLLYGAAIAIGGFVGYVGGTIIEYVIQSIWSDEKKEIYLSILGPINSGKTTIHNYFRNTKYTGATIGANNMKEVEITNDNTGQKLIIKNGKDIAGSEQAIKAFYENEINQANMIFFLADSTKLITENTYKEDVRARLNFIIKKNKLRKESAKIYILASFVDMLSKNQSDDKNRVWDTIEDIANEGGIESPIFIDLTNHKHLTQLKDKLFE